MRLALQELPKDSYTALWRSRSAADGHITQGSVPFGVGVAATTTSLIPAPDAPDQDDHKQGDAGHQGKDEDVDGQSWRQQGESIDRGGCVLRPLRGRNRARRCEVVLLARLSRRGVGQVIRLRKHSDHEVVVAFDEHDDVHVGGSYRVGEMAAEVLVKPTYRNRLAVVPVRSVLGFGGVQPALCACASAEGDDDLEQDVTASVLDPAPPETSHEAVMFQRRLGAGWVGRGKEADVLEHVEIALDRHESLRVLDVIGGRRRRKHRIQSRRRGGRCDGGRRGRQQGRDTRSRPGDNRCRASRAGPHRAARA